MTLFIVFIYFILMNIHESLPKNDNEFYSSPLLEPFWAFRNVRNMHCIIIKVLKFENITGSATFLSPEVLDKGFGPACTTLIFRLIKL